VYNIRESILRGERKLADVPVAVSMSWAANRTTPREKDIAYSYSLIEIFDINIAMLYGEMHQAF
jgi:hypothetical protein